MALLTKMDQGKGVAMPRADTGGSGHGLWKRHWARLQEHCSVKVPDQGTRRVRSRGGSAAGSRLYVQWLSQGSVSAVGVTQGDGSGVGDGDSGGAARRRRKLEREWLKHGGSGTGYDGSLGKTRA